MISSDLESQYGHPNNEALEAFVERDYETYWTAVHGDVTVRTDGSTLVVDIDALPEDGQFEGAVFVVDLDGEELHEVSFLPDVTSKRREEAQDRLDLLSTRLDDSDEE